MNSTQSSASGSPNASMKMSADARTRMLLTEKVVLRYYNDMGKKGGNCTWGPGLLAHKGICTEEELLRKVSSASVNAEFEKRVAEAEKRVARKTTVKLNQAQFDALTSFTYNTSYLSQNPIFDAINESKFCHAAALINRAVKVQIGTGKNKKYVTATGLIRRRAEESAPFQDAANPR